MPHARACGVHLAIGCSWCYKDSIGGPPTPLRTLGSKSAAIGQLTGNIGLYSGGLNITGKRAGHFPESGLVDRGALCTSTGRSLRVNLAQPGAYGRMLSNPFDVVPSGLSGRTRAERLELSVQSLADLCAGSSPARFAKTSEQLHVSAISSQRVGMLGAENLSSNGYNPAVKWFGLSLTAIITIGGR
jgi:hypothetical protein